MFKHYLIPVDDYTVEHADFPRLSAMAQRDSAKITLAHVSDPLPAVFYLQNGFGGDYITVEKSGADVILMNSHKRSGFKALLMGSETREVMADSRLPVLVL